MTDRAELKSVDVCLNQELVDALAEDLATRRFSARLRLATRQMIDSCEESPKEVTRELTANAHRARIRGRRRQTVKRITVGFRVDELLRLDSTLERLRKRMGGLNRQELMRLSLLLWPKQR